MLHIYVYVYRVSHIRYYNLFPLKSYIDIIVIFNYMIYIEFKF